MGDQFRHSPSSRWGLLMAIPAPSPQAKRLIELAGQATRDAPSFGNAVHRAPFTSNRANDASTANMARTSPLSTDGTRRVRGPRHRRPTLLRFTALIHVLTRLAFLGTVVGIPVATLYDPKLIGLLAFLPVMLLVCGSLWLITAAKVGCRVCAMRMFLNKKCVKSRKAPNWKPLGPHTTLAILALFYRSVRCPYCGTPNELSEPDPD